MEDRFWNSIERDTEMMDEEDRFGGSGLTGATVRINGMVLSLEVGSSFKDTVVNTAKDAGFGKFRVYLNGEEVKPSMAPETIVEGTRMEIRAFDPAA